MPKIVVDESGAEVEMFSAEELESQKNSAIEEFKKANPDQVGDMDKLQEELKTAQEELSKYKDKDYNFSELRKAKDLAENKVDKIAKEIDEKIATVKKEVTESFMEDYRKDVIKSLAGGDEEVVKKIEFHYGRLQDSPKSKEEVAKKVNDAFVLATGRSVSGVMDASVVGSSGVGRLNVQSQDKKFTPEEKEFAKKLAEAGGIKLEEKDFNK